MEISDICDTAPQMAGKSDKKPTRDPILRGLDRVCRRVGFWKLGWGYMWALLLLVLMIAAGVLLDHLVVLQEWGRLAFFRSFLVAAGLAALAATLYPLAARVGRLYLARQAERKFPSLGNSLVSYLQVRGDSRVPAGAKVLLGRRAGPYVRRLDTSMVVDHARYRRMGVVIVAVVMVFGLYCLFSPKSATVSLARLVHPRADILPPTATKLVRIEPGDIYAVAGAEPDLNVTVEGRSPRNVYAVWDAQSFSGRRIILSRSEQNHWKGQFPPLLEDGAYHVVAGDTRSDRFVIETLPEPVVEDVRLEVHLPSYGEEGLRTVKGGDVETVPGALIKVTAKTSLPPGKGHLRFRSGRRVELAGMRSRNLLRGEFSIQASDAYSIHFESVQYPGGRTFRNTSPIEFTITCGNDEAPTVVLRGPPDGTRMSPPGKARLTYSASDDFGLSGVWLRYEPTGGEGGTVQIADDPPRKIERAGYVWDLSAIPLKPGQALTYFLEVKDNHPGKPQVARSRTFSIVMPPEAGKKRRQSAEGREIGKGGPAEGKARPGEGDRRRVEESVRKLRRWLAGEESAEQAPATGEKVPAEESAGETAEDREATSRKDGEQRPEERERGEEKQEGGKRKEEEEQGDQAEEEEETEDEKEKEKETEEPPPPDEVDPKRQEELKRLREGPTNAPGTEDRETGRSRAVESDGGAAEGTEEREPPPPEDMPEVESTRRTEEQPDEAGEPAEIPSGKEGQGVAEAAAGEGEAGKPQAAPTEQLPGGTGNRTAPGESTRGGGLPDEQLDDGVERLEGLLDQDRLPEEFMKDLGMNRRKLRELIQRYRQQEVEEPKAEEESGQRAPVAPMQMPRLLEGGEASEDVQSAEADTGDEPGDRLRSRFEGATEQLSPRYRELVNRYYKALSEER